MGEVKSGIKAGRVDVTILYGGNFYAFVIGEGNGNVVIEEVALYLNGAISCISTCTKVVIEDGKPDAIGGINFNGVIGGCFGNLGTVGEDIVGSVLGDGDEYSLI